MAEVKDNLFTEGLSGMVGKKMVFRTRFGRTIVSKRPIPTSIPPTEEQTQQRSRFAQAVIYAKAAILDPIRKAMYATLVKPFESAFNVAVADYAAAPEVKLIITELYTGNVGDKITVQAVDDAKVSKVHVVIRTAGGVLIEQGNAVADPNGLDWIYTATEHNISLSGCVVTATAYDFPGNQNTTSKAL